jgi:uncharacterized membrane protein SirB2
MDGRIFPVAIATILLVGGLWMLSGAIHPKLESERRWAFAVIAFLLLIMAAGFLWGARNWSTINGG